MAGIYRMSITTAGLQASRLYELSDEDEAHPRAAALIRGGLLVKQPDANIGGGATLSAPSIPLEGEPDKGTGAYVDPDGSDNGYLTTSRHGVPAVPT